jgi:hypoxanthine phosphoribosyltransferase
MPTQRAIPRPVRDVAEVDVLELTWDVFGELCRALAVKVAQSGYAPEIVVGIAKAGVIPGAVVASMLGCDFFSMKISRDTDTGKTRARPKIIQAAPREAFGKRVLIVDEITTSGDTLRMATNALRQVGPAEIRTATNFVKVGSFKPDFYALETSSTVVFPWDRELVSDAGALVANPFYSEVL